MTGSRHIVTSTALPIRASDINIANATMLSGAYHGLVVSGLSSYVIFWNLETVLLEQRPIQVMGH